MTNPLAVPAQKVRVVGAIVRTQILTLESAAMAACGRKELAMWSNYLIKNVTKQEKSII